MILLKLRRSRSTLSRTTLAGPSISGVSMRVRKYPRPCPALLFSTRPCVPLAAARLFHLPLATSCPAQRGKADVQSGLPADAASLRETGSVDRYTPRGPVSQLAAVQCLVSLILSLMAPRVCTLVLSICHMWVANNSRKKRP